ncbi:MAG: hypothetical protein Q8K58_02330 [Acidimicrobiales bacterium]|nr:hypothetical protein [Acidimicrobiales bacterium]
MTKRIRIAVAAATIVGGFTIAQAGTASAAHCAKNGSPGFSYYGQDGRFEDTNGPGANECAALPGNPSVRAPGQNRP